MVPVVSTLQNLGEIDNRHQRGKVNGTCVNTIGTNMKTFALRTPAGQLNMRTHVERCVVGRTHSAVRTHGPPNALRRLKGVRLRAVVENQEVQPSLFEELGGMPAIEAAVDIFYRKNYSDPRVMKWFDGISQKRQAQKMIKFLSFALKGEDYPGRDLTEAHAKLVDDGLADVDFDVIVENLAASLQELDVPEDLVKQVADVVMTTKGPVLGRK